MSVIGLRILVGANLQEKSKVILFRPLPPAKKATTPPSYLAPPPLAARNNLAL